MDTKEMKKIDEMEMAQPSLPEWAPKVLLIGGVIGAVVGLLSEYLYIQSIEEGEQPEISAGKGLRIGLLLLGLVRNVADLAD
jgi:hypothetical protein